MFHALFVFGIRTAFIHESLHYYFDI